MRLKTGEDIITQVTNETSKTVEIINPMVILFKRLETGRAMILMSPWIPIEIVCDNSTVIDTNNIISTMKPRQSLIDHYIETVERMSEIVIDENEIEMSSLDDEDEEEYDEEEFQTKDKKQLH